MLRGWVRKRLIPLLHVSASARDELGAPQLVSTHYVSWPRRVSFSQDTVYQAIRKMRKILFQILNFRLRSRSFAFETLSLTSVLRLSVLSFRDLGGQLSFSILLASSDSGTPRTNCRTYGTSFEAFSPPLKIIPSLFKSFSLS